MPVFWNPNCKVEKNFIGNFFFVFCIFLISQRPFIVEANFWTHFEDLCIGNFIKITKNDNNNTYIYFIFSIFQVKFFFKFEKITYYKKLINALFLKIPFCAMKIFGIYEHLSSYSIRYNYLPKILKAQNKIFRKIAFESYL
jgi:hypothetical protein